MLDESALNDLAERGWVTIENWIDAGEAVRLRDRARSLHDEGRFDRAGVGRGTERRLAKDVRSDEISWLDRSAGPEVEALFARLESLRVRLNETLFLGLNDFEAHFALYRLDGFYDRHVDRFRDDDARTISAVLYLNPEWTEEAGGELAIFTDEGEFRVPPRAGTLVLFQSATIEHQVLPAHRERWSAAIWFRRRKPGLMGLKS